MALSLSEVPITWKMKGSWQRKAKHQAVIPIKKCGNCFGRSKSLLETRFSYGEPTSSPSQPNTTSSKRELQSIPFYPICKLEAKDTVHTQWRCEFTRDVWSVFSKSLQKCYLPQLSMLQLFDTIPRTISHQIIQEFVIVSRKIQCRRNCFIFKEEFAHLSILLKEARGTLEMLAEEATSRALRTSKICTLVENWQAPSLNWYKLNWDGAMDKAQCLIGIGVAVRDSASQIIATMRTSKHMFPNPYLIRLIKHYKQ